MANIKNTYAVFPAQNVEFSSDYHRISINHFQSIDIDWRSLGKCVSLKD